MEAIWTELEGNQLNVLCCIVSVLSVLSFDQEEGFKSQDGGGGG